MTITTRQHKLATRRAAWKAFTARVLKTARQMTTDYARDTRKVPDEKMTFLDRIRASFPPVEPEIMWMQGHSSVVFNLRTRIIRIRRTTF